MFLELEALGLQVRAVAEVGPGPSDRLVLERLVRLVVQDLILLEHGLVHNNLCDASGAALLFVVVKGRVHAPVLARPHI